MFCIKTLISFALGRGIVMTVENVKNLVNYLTTRSIDFYRRRFILLLDIDW